ncbi:hypothetical protein PFISCL1PPCAC_15862, partial [Pristionchus fissidentatus]
RLNSSKATTKMTPTHSQSASTKERLLSWMRNRKAARREASAQGDSSKNTRLNRNGRENIPEWWHCGRPCGEPLAVPMKNLSRRHVSLILPCQQDAVYNEHAEVD